MSHGVCPAHVLLIELECKHCHLQFLMYRKCYRGHVYCSTVCRLQSQIFSHREFQRKYRQTLKGKLAHCLNEKRRRMGRVKKTMADETTARVVFRVMSYPWDRKNTPRCSFCGVFGKIVKAFPLRH